MYRLATHSRTRIRLAACLAVVSLSSIAPGADLTSRSRARVGDMRGFERDQTSTASGDLSSYISVAPRAERVKPGMQLPPAAESKRKSGSTGKSAIAKAAALASIPEVGLRRLTVGSQPRPEGVFNLAETTANIQLQPATSQRLFLHEEVAHVDVIDSDICTALKSGARELDLIARRAGETAVAVYYKQGRSAETYRISVGTGNEGQTTTSNDEQLETLIAEIFPRSAVTLTPQEESLLVSGVVKSDREAVRILSLVRSLRLIPVVDQLKVQR